MEILGTGPAGIPPPGPGRDRFVLEHRPAPPVHDPWRVQGLDVEDEAHLPEGTLAHTATVFLTGRECPWRCVMCDLWRFTTPGPTPPGAIPAQLSWARRELARRGKTVTQWKLYNASSFFDPLAVPPADYGEIARVLADAGRVTVESHPALVGRRVDDLLAAFGRAAHPGGPPPALEVAMGLETAHPEALAALNKRMTLDDFRRAASSLSSRGVSLRAFLLVHPPFIRPDAQDEWALRSIDEGVNAGASVISLIPTRPGNGALEALAARGLFTAPGLADAERTFEAGMAHIAGRARVFLDLWDLDRLSACRECFEARRARLQAMNRRQQVLPRVACPACAGGSP